MAGGGQVIRQNEGVNLPLRGHEPVQETVRRAVAISPHAWKVNPQKNLSVFDGKFYLPVCERVDERGMLWIA